MAGDKPKDPPVTAALLQGVLLFMTNRDMALTGTAPSPETAPYLAFLRHMHNLDGGVAYEANVLRTIKERAEERMATIMGRVEARPPRTEKARKQVADEMMALAEVVESATTKLEDLQYMAERRLLN